MGKSIRSENQNGLKARHPAIVKFIQPENADDISIGAVLCRNFDKYEERWLQFQHAFFLLLKNIQGFSFKIIQLPYAGYG